MPHRAFAWFSMRGHPRRVRTNASVTNALAPRPARGRGAWTTGLAALLWLHSAQAQTVPVAGGAAPTANTAAHGAAHSAVNEGAAPAAATGNCTKLVATGNPDYPPFLWRPSAQSPHLVGANADLMQLVAAELGVPIEMRHSVTWARAQEEARRGRVDLIAGAFFTVPRLEYMDYVYPPFHVTRSVVWMRKASGIKYQQWEDLRGRTGATLINNSFGERFDQFAKAALKITTVPSLEQGLGLLERGRVDYFVYEEAPAQAYIAKLDLKGLGFDGDVVSNEGLYLTLSHKSPCNTPELRAQLAKIMHELAQKGVMQQLIDTNVQAWRKTN